MAKSDGPSGVRAQTGLVAPYPLPPHWSWTTLEQICLWKRGISFPASAVCSEATCHTVPCLRTSNLRCTLDMEHVLQVDTRLLQSHPPPLIQPGDILLSLANTRSLVGKPSYCHQPPCPMTFGSFLLRITPKHIVAKYLFYYLQWEFLLGHLGAISKQSTNLANLPIKALRNYPVPLPPYREQLHLVAQLDTLLERLEKAQKHIRACLALLDQHQAHLLYQGCGGYLTSEWRKTHPPAQNYWPWVTVSQLCPHLPYGTAKKSHPQGEVAVLHMGNLQQGEICWSPLVYSSDPEEIAKYTLQPGDVLFNRTNSPALVGKSAIYRGERPAIYGSYLIKLDYDPDQISGEYLNYVLNSPHARSYCRHVQVQGANQANISRQKLAAYSFPLPSLSEQREIVRILQCLLGRERTLKQLALQSVKTIDQLTCSILAQAFQGRWSDLSQKAAPVSAAQPIH